MLDNRNMVEISEQNVFKLGRLRVLVVPISVDSMKKYLPQGEINNYQTLTGKTETHKSDKKSCEETFKNGFHLKLKGKIPSIEMRLDDESFASHELDRCVITTSSSSEKLAKPATDSVIQLASSARESEYGEDDWLIRSTDTYEYNGVFQNIVFNSAGKLSCEDMKEYNSVSRKRTLEDKEETQKRWKSSPKHSSHLNGQCKVSPPEKKSTRDERIRNLKELLAQQEDAVNRLMLQPKIVLSDCLENSESYHFERKPLTTSKPLSELQRTFSAKVRPVKRRHRDTKTERKDTAKRRRVDEGHQETRRKNVTSRRRQNKFSNYKPKPEYVEMRKKRDLWMSKDTVVKDDFFAAMGLFPVKTSSVLPDLSTS